MTVKFKFEALGQPLEADWPVKILVPQDGGAVEEQTLVARFRLPPAGEEESAEAQLQMSFFVGLGKDEPELTPQLRAQLLGRDYVRMALYKAFGEFRMGVAVKN